jgi:hypothetical protein
MEKKLQNYLYLYLGCDVLVDGKDIGKLIGYETRGFGTDDFMILYTVQLSEKEDDWTVYNDDEKMQRIKPFLRPLSDIQKEEVADLMRVDGFIVKGNFSYSFFQIEFKDLYEVTHFKHLYIHQLDPNQFLFLLSKGFDLLGMIEAGFAMDKAKIESFLLSKIEQPD